MDNNSEDTITVTSALDNLDYTIDMSTLSVSVPSFTGNVTVNGTSGTYGSGQFLTSNGSNGTSWTTSPYIYTTNNTTAPPGLHVTGPAEFEGDVKIQGQSILKLLKSIEDRLAILQPDPAKLEKYAALKKAYEHYKTLERLIGED
jgi:hypothetical protein